MHDAGSWGATWQTLAPLLAATVAIVLMKWSSQKWSAEMLARTVRVTSRLKGSRVLRH